MNVNKRLDRMRQWGKEKMGAQKTDTTDDFKMLEAEMNMRQEGLERLHNSMGAYVKSLQRRTEGEGKEKLTPAAYLAQTMSKHGESFEEGSRFGECLVTLGQAEERMARSQETLAVNSTASWLEALERGVTQMKDYQNARKKLESRRLAYDTSLGKVQKAKKDDFRAEEELRSQKAKHDESTEDVYRRMQDIVDAEAESCAELYAFLEAELNYHERCRELLLQAKRTWPAAAHPSTEGSSRGTRSRTSTLSRATTLTDDDLNPPMLPFRSRASSGTNSPSHERPAYDMSPVRTPLTLSRTATNEGGQRPNLGRPPADAAQMVRSATGLSVSSADDGETLPFKKKAPPPPPPSRSTKPPPPPPPMRRSALSSPAVPTLT